MILRRVSSFKTLWREAIPELITITKDGYMILGFLTKKFIKHLNPKRKHSFNNLLHPKIANQNHEKTAANISQNS
jgi:hypothetical protein